MKNPTIQLPSFHIQQQADELFIYNRMSGSRLIFVGIGLLGFGIAFMISVFFPSLTGSEEESVPFVSGLITGLPTALLAWLFYRFWKDQEVLLMENGRLTYYVLPNQDSSVEVPIADITHVALYDDGESSNYMIYINTLNNTKHVFFSNLTKQQAQAAVDAILAFLASDTDPQQQP